MEEKGRLLPRYREFLSKIFACTNSNDERSANFSAEILEYLTIAHTGLSDEIDYIENRFFNDDYNYDFKRILVKSAKGKENLLIKQFAAKLTCMKIYRSNVEILLETLEGNETNSLVVSKRIIDYLKNFTPDTKEEKQTRDLMIEPELSELGSKGLKTIYAMKKLNIIPDTTVDKSKRQILGALTLISRASAFPPLNFAVANITSIMISEAIASIVLAIFKENNNIDDLLCKTEYLKGKLI